MSPGALTRLILMLLAGVVVSPSVGQAQSAIAGVARDTSGAVLPGVTVEASSPALIEKVRTVTTDASGLYTVSDLRPGTYVVLFTLPGLSTVQREGIVARDQSHRERERGTASWRHRRNGDRVWVSDHCRRSEHPTKSCAGEEGPRRTPIISHLDD